MVEHHSLRLTLFPGRYSVWQLPPDAPLPRTGGDGLLSVTRTRDELSVVAREGHNPGDGRCEPGWRCLGVTGPLAFDLTGVLASLTAPLAAAEVPLFAVSTYATDYLLVRDADLARALVALDAAGHHVASDDAVDPTLGLVRFIRHTLGCGCPPEVFAGIDVRAEPEAFAGLPADVSIDVGGRLLVVVVGSAGLSEVDRSLPDVVSRGRVVRDAGGFNRIRLVVATPGATAAASTLGERFRGAAGTDDRLHLHVIDPGHLPELRSP